MQTPLSMGKRCQQLKPPAAPPLLRVRVSVPGQPDEFITDPKEVDKAAIDAWAKVHKGNISVKAADSAILSFMSTLGTFSSMPIPCPLSSSLGIRCAKALQPHLTTLLV